MARLAKLVFLVLLISSAACKEEAEPVDIPFQGFDVSAKAANEPPPPSPSPSETVAPTPPVKPLARTGGFSIGGCCAALAASASKAKKSGTRAMYQQAQGICSRNSQRVRQGKMTRASALAAVRGALLEGVPGSCR